MSKIFNKIAGLYLFVIIPLTAVILFLIFDVIHNHYINTITSNLKGLNYVLQDQIRNNIIVEDKDNLSFTSKRISNLTNTRITVISPRGIVLADTDENPEKMENHAARIEIAQALSGKMGATVRYSNTVKKKMLYVALPIYKSKELIGVSRVSMYINYIDELYSELRNKILLITALVMLISIIIILLFSRQITNPIKELVRASKQFSSGDFNTKVIIENNDEIKELADNFNLMTDKIRELFESQSMQEEELKRIIRSMQEGLIVLDKDNRIILFNKSFQKTVKTSDIENKYYWEILRHESVQKLVNKVRKKRSHKSSEISIENSYYLCSCNYIQSKDEIVMVLFDISQQKQIENMKRDFIINASHELRTPLTAIRGFVETMEDESFENKPPKGRDRSVNNYLDVIKRHTTRLIAIVEDLLTISKMEDENENLHLEKIDFKELTNGLLVLFDNRLKDGKLNLDISIDQNLKEYQGDYFKLEQVFINLIDNAIKYTNKGEIKVSVEDAGDNVKIKISDTGIGIPQSEINRIFERFYTVDKSRSRKSGGTGLGLSIVKHIVQLHEGTIRVESAVGKGTTFIITLLYK
jgi:two-component system, OmpR family, phosphate regulon sensor histidine kinase PhoR